MLEGPVAGHPRGLALLALVVLAPATVFVAGSVLAYQLGLTSLIGPMESINAWLAAQRVAGVVLMASPAVALLLALAPLVRLQLRAGQSGSAGVVGIQTRLANLAVASLALIVGGLIAWHAIFESIAERAT
jgi:hypothetical protein